MARTATLCWIYRNPNILNGGDDTLQVGLFLMLISPCGRALSLDAWLRRRRTGDTAPAFVPPWSVRVLQIQLAVIYITTGLAKLGGDGALTPEQSRDLLAVRVLEGVGTPEARKALESLVRDSPGWWVTQEAKAALERLGKEK